VPGDFACSFAVAAPDLIVGHLLPYHFVVVAVAAAAAAAAAVAVAAAA
jgi:hypothetical protein